MDETPPIQKPVKKKSPPPAHSRWKKGQSGNPGGRPKGTGKRQKELQALVQQQVELQVGQDARKLLSQHSTGITAEIIRIATKVEATPSQAKIKCLLACFERIVPSLKVIELKPDEDGKKPHELSDTEIVTMMERMIALAQEGNDNASSQACLET